MKSFGITNDLKILFQIVIKILSLVYYLIFEKILLHLDLRSGSVLHKHPYAKVYLRKWNSELFASIKDDAKIDFFTLQAKRKVDKEFWVYDTNINIKLLKTLSQVQYGHNKEHDPLAQINLALVFGESSCFHFTIVNYQVIYQIQKKLLNIY